jgi:uncharacterized protein YecT (DUF1311 family)
VKRRDWLTFVLVVLVMPATAVTAERASFDCLKAATPIEQLICSDPQLLTLDGALGNAFAAYRQRLPEKDRAGALAEQRAWLALRLKQCDVPAKGGAELALEVRWRAAPCLDEMYRARLAALGAPAEPRPPPLPQLAELGFIHPNCLWPIIDQDPEQATKTPPRIPLEACARGNRHIAVSTGDQGSFSAQGAVEGFPTWLSYRLLGKLPDERDVAIVWYNSGGTGQFSELYLLRRAPTDGLRELVLTGELVGGGGDRCNGGIEEAKLSGGPALEVDYNLTPLDLLSEADEGVAEQAFEGLLSCAICCIGTVRRRLDLASKKETIVSATITQFLDDEMATGGAKSVQACFDALARKAAGSLPHTFSPVEINALAQSFARTCLKK